MPTQFEGDCPTCGPTIYSVANNPSDAAPIKCEKCGYQLMTWGDLKKNVMVDVVPAAKKALSKVKGFKPS